MCTVSIIPIGTSPSAYRLVTNRDEQRSRAVGQPPGWRDLGGVRAIAPRDPISGGTWVATSETGLTLCLLNGNPEPPPQPPAHPASRGELIERFIGLATIDAIVEATRLMDLSPYPPFRLVAIQPIASAAPGRTGPRIADLFWDRRAPVWTTDHALPVCFVSSGLGDSRVAPRLTLFDTIVAPTPTPEAQDAFHEHVWPERPEISVRMARRDARTVSITRISVDPAPDRPASIQLEYLPVGDQHDAALATASKIG